MISVVIPTINEAERLGPCLKSVAACDRPSEIVVADAGSRDGTAGIARAHGARVVECPVQSRAAQMNAAARECGGDALLFLHADTTLHADALRSIDEALANRDVAGGAFARRYDKPSRFLAATCRMADWRCRRTGWFLGDQGIFCRRDVFDAIGGFREVARFEDLEFSRGMKRHGRTVLLDAPVLTSARRFEREGVVRRTVGDFFLTVRYLAAGPQAAGGETPVAVRNESQPSS